MSTRKVLFLDGPLAGQLHDVDFNSVAYDAIDYARIGIQSPSFGIGSSETVRYTLSKFGFHLQGRPVVIDYASVEPATIEMIIDHVLSEKARQAISVR